MDLMDQFGPTADYLDVTEPMDPWMDLLKVEDAIRTTPTASLPTALILPLEDLTEPLEIRLTSITTGITTSTSSSLMMRRSPSKLPNSEKGTDQSRTEEYH